MLAPPARASGCTGDQATLGETVQIQWGESILREGNLVSTPANAASPSR